MHHDVMYAIGVDERLHKMPEDFLKKIEANLCKQWSWIVDHVNFYRRVQGQLKALTPSWPTSRGWLSLSS